VAAGLSPGGPDVAMPTVTIDEDDPVTILFTSGTTGRSKGATLTHRNWIHFALCNNCAGAVGMALAGLPLEAAPAAQPSAIFAAPIFHVSGTGPLTNAPFSGMKLVLPPPGRWDETVTLEFIERHKVTTMSGVPTQFWRLLQHPNFDSYDLSSVTTIGGGGAVCPPELARLMFAKLPRAGAGQGYGMSETAGMGTRLGGPAFKARPETVGTAQVTMRLQIRDPQGNVLSAGHVGEIYIWGAGVFREYWNNPEATGAVLDSERWYRSGDFGRTDGEFLTLESRMRDLIIRGGENIYPIEIENRLVEHPEVADAAVIGVDHQALGQEVKAFIVPAAGCNPSIDDIRRFVSEALASFKVPTYVEFREALPYSATGKLLKRELEEEDRAVQTA
jgi:acyl-CoA synthetase (AMP-forming)/AMP-acid ligase II